MARSSFSVDVAETGSDGNLGLLRDSRKRKQTLCGVSILSAALATLMLNSVLLIVILIVVLSPNNSSAGAEDKQFSNGVCSSLCSPVCITLDSSCFSNCYNYCDTQQGFVRPASLGSWILPQAIQHVGVTTSNLSRSVKFYTEIMGGVEVNFAGGNGWKGDDVYQLLMQAALIRGGDAATWAANISAHGDSQLDARYVSFGSMIIEFLDYHSEEARLQQSLVTGERFPRYSPSNVAPSVAANMHVSFNIRPERDLNEFVLALEAKAHAAGFANVVCNRLVPVQNGPDGHPDVAGVPITDNSYVVKSGGFEGWSLAYCKGPDGEQLEMNQVKKKAQDDFDQALRTYLSGGKNHLW